MACFLKVTRLGGRASVMRTSGLAKTIGIDRNGSVTDSLHRTALFTLYSIKERTLLRADTAGAMLNGETLGLNAVKWIAPGDCLSRNDITFRLFPTGSLSRIVSRSSLSRGSAEVSTRPVMALVGTIAGLSQRWMIPAESSIIVGSDHRADVQIDLPGVFSHHFIVSTDPHEGTIRPLDGKILIDGRVCTGSTRIHDRTEITLMPLRLTLHLEPTGDEPVIQERSETRGPAQP